MKKGCTILLLLLVWATNEGFGQLGVGTTTPNASSILDVSSTTQGALLPRMTQAQRVALNPLPAAAQGLTVYQTDGSQGFYYNTSTTTTPVWVQLGAANDSWSLSGNAGTTPGTHFLGTTDAVDFVLQTNSTERMRVESGGNIGVGTADPTTLLDVRGSGAFGNSFTPDADNAGNALNLNIGSSNNGASNGISFYENDDGFGMGLGYDGTGTGPTNALRIYDDTETSIVTFENGGEVGIGTNTPAEELHVVGSIRMVDGNEANGRVLVSDANGTAVWTNPATLATSADFNNNGDNSGANRSIGNNDGFDLNIETNGVSRIDIESDGDVVVNETSTNADFRVESNNEVNMLFVDGGTNRIGAGTGTPNTTFHITEGTAGDAILTIEADTDNNNEGDNPTILFSQDGGAITGFTGLSGNANSFSAGVLGNSLLFGSEGGNTAVQFITNDVVRGTFTTDGDFGIGSNAPIVRLDVRGFGAFGTAFTPDNDNDNNILNLMSGSSANGASNGISFFESDNGFGMGLGYDGVGTGDANALRIYDDNEAAIFTFENGGELGIGTTTPAEELHVVGSIRMVDGNQANGRVLISDANGTGVWTDPGAIAGAADFSNNGDNAGANRSIGNNDASDLNIETNGISRIDIESAGNVIVNETSRNVDFRVESNNDVNMFFVDGSTNRIGVGTNTPSTSVHISEGTAGDAVLTLEADTDNSNENDNPTIVFSQDGGATTGYVGLAGNANSFSTNTLTNAMLIGTEDNNALQFITNDAVRGTFSAGGDFGLGTTNPGAALDVTTDAIFNSSGGNNDFQVEGQNEGNLLYVDASTDRIGMGTNTPVSTLHISEGTAGDAVLTIEADTDNSNENDNPRIQLEQDGGLINGFFALSGNGNSISNGTLANSVVLGSENGNSNLHFVTNDVVRGTFSVGGDFGLGTTNPGAALDVSTDAVFNSSSGNNDFQVEGQNDANLLYADASSDRVGIGCGAPRYKLHVIGDIAAEGGTIRASSAVISTTITACSDKRYKEDIRSMEGSLDRILQLRGVNYYFRTEQFPEKQFSEEEQVGFIAQELEEVFPFVVQTDEEGYKSVDYSRLTPLLVEAMKEMNQQMSAQAEELELLKAQMQALQNQSSTTTAAVSTTASSTPR